jgi:hypothetical protein
MTPCPLLPVAPPADLHPPFAGAWRKGATAATQGAPRRPPYPDTRTARGAITFSRAFCRSWLRGYDATWAASSPDA